MASYFSDFSGGFTDAVLNFVATRYTQQEEVPSYKDSTEGFPKYLGVLERVKMDTYYPSVLEKAAYLLISINKGHFFSNGNKRLALVTMTFFLIINDFDLKGYSKDEYKNILANIFPNYDEFWDFADFTSTDFATYNLSIIIADSTRHSLNHETLKVKVLEFLTVSTEKWMSTVSI